MKDLLLESALAFSGVHSESEILEWVKKNHANNSYEIDLKPLSELRQWNFSDGFDCYGHKSGKFFKIQGLRIHQERFGCSIAWDQPIVVQPEIGILGLIGKIINDVLHVLVQAKMEPGNINLTQISPTVQATESNYSQVHGGKKPKFIDYFFDNSPKNILFDKLQSEQGSRYFSKLNRNIIIQIPDHECIELDQEFLWVTIGQLQKLMQYPNIVHLDCRSILGGVSYSVKNMNINKIDVNRSAHLFSYLGAGDEANYIYSLRECFAWKDQQQSEVKITRRIIPLSDMSEWSVDNDSIGNLYDKYFKIIGVSVAATNREVSGWDQPLIFSKPGGIIGLLAQRQRGVLKFLIQALAEPGLINSVELAATVQFTPDNYSAPEARPLPYFADLFLSPRDVRVLFDSELSDEGGRFYHSTQRHMIIEVPENTELTLPSNYRWMSFLEIQAFAQNSSQINIELRSIISCINLALIEMIFQNED